MVNLAIIGCGAITIHRHAPECLASQNIHLAGVFDVNLQRAEEVATKFQCKAFQAYEDVLNDENIDGVIICVNNRFHRDMTVQALQHKKHVLCEKPMAVTVEEAQDMIDAAKKAGCYLMIAHHQRLMPVNQKLKEILETRDLGKIISFTTSFTHAGPETWSVEKTNKTWFLNKNEAGLGALGDIGIHKADLIHWLLGEDIKYVTAVLGTLDKKDATGNPIGMEDNAFAILETENGIMGTLEASWTHYGKGSNQTKIYCENGVVESIDEKKVVVHYKNGETETFEMETVSSKIVESFAHCLEKHNEPEISGEEGMKALQIVLACVESSEKHGRVEIK